MKGAGFNSRSGFQGIGRFFLHRSSVDAVEGRREKTKLRHLLFCEGLKPSARWRRGSVLVVGFFLRRVGDAVLSLRRTRAQAVEPAAVLSVVDVVLEEQLPTKTEASEHR